MKHTNTAGARRCSTQHFAVRAASLAAVLLTTMLTTTAGAAELVVNGSFEEPVITAEQGWMSYYGENAPDGYPEDFCPEGTPPELPECNDGETVPGWTVFWQDTLLDEVPEAGRLELQSNEGPDGLPVGDILAADGSQKAELDGHYRDDDYTDEIFVNENVFLGQEMLTCARTPYEFSYAWKARRDVPGDNDILVLIDDEVVLTNTEFKQTWERENYKFLASPTGLSLLGFTSVGSSNTFGMLIDDVSVQGLDGSDPANCPPPRPICPNPDSLTLLYDADLSEDDFFAQDPSSVVITDFGELQPWVQIRVIDPATDAELFSGAVRIGQTFSFMGPGGGPVPDELEIQINDQTGPALQTVIFDARNLAVGEEFGGVAVWDGECPCICEDEGRDVTLDFTGLTPNQVFDGETFGGFGIHFSGSRTNKPLMIQDTSDPTLPAPSQDHFNPIQGNALTFSRFDDPAGSPRELAGPQQFNVDFDEPVTVRAITTMDNEEDGSEIRVYGDNGLIKTVPVPVTPDGTGNWNASLQRVVVDAENVTRLEFDSTGSTFIDDLELYYPCGEVCVCDDVSSLR